MTLRWPFYVVVALLVAGALAYGAFTYSPWPSVLIIRHAFSKDAEARNEALAKHVPQGIAALADQPYGDDGLLDAYFPADAQGRLPTVVWIHGGGFVAGDRTDVAEYLKILAGRGYAAIAVGYTRAPTARYPGPVLQANAALAFLIANAERFHIDPERIVLAGDSAGAQIAAQLAATLGDPAYAAAVGVTPALAAERLKGIVLFCGIYDLGGLNMTGSFADFLKTVLWSYFGIEDASQDPRMDQFSVIRHLTAAFPPTFISVGNGDPLAPQSASLAAAIAEKGVPVDSLFFAADRQPPLQHEYQFNLDDAAGGEALDRLTTFLAARAG